MGPRDATSDGLVLRLYVVRDSLYSARARRNLDALRQHLPEDARVEVIEVSEQPDLAAEDAILATPALVRVLPEPRCKVIGDLTDIPGTLDALHVPARPG